ncbi:MAG: magnesium chelatase subunit D [Pseudomonadota bacterium]
MTGVEPRYDAWTDAQLAAALLAVDPDGLGGASLRGLAGPPREAWLEHFRSLLPADAPALRMPTHITPDRLLGGLDLTATLASGRPVIEAGLLARADGGAVIAAMAERMTSSTAALVAGALDSGEIRLERDGSGRCFPARIVVIALDEGLTLEEAPPESLQDRLAFHLDLGLIRSVATSPFAIDGAMVAEARGRLRSIVSPEAIHAALTETAMALGVGSLRAALFAARAARAAAALAGEEVVSDTDAALAARLVLAPRATTLPRDPEAEPDEPQEATPPPESTESQGDDADDEARSDRPPTDVVLEAAQAAIPPGLLEALRFGAPRRSRSRSAGKSGEKSKSNARGRPIGTRAGQPTPDKPLNLVATLRAAAPWQRLRGAPLSAAAPEDRRVAVRGDDFRTTRFKQRTETVTIFVVDASGSAAMQRLAEAKGAVELLLAECYVRRDQVALIAFRGTSAELLLSPTRSLVRAKRSLAGLPGGGGTPLATAMEAATELAEQVRRRGQTPVVVMLTDGRANITRGGEGGRAQAHDDALTAARGMNTAGVSTIFVDTSPRPQRKAREIAEAMDARYVPLPFADARGLSAVVQGHATGRVAA